MSILQLNHGPKQGKLQVFSFETTFDDVNESFSNNFNFVSTSNSLANYMKKTYPKASEIKQMLSPRDFYSYELLGAKFKKAEWNEGGLCPFHDDNQPGSFFINLKTGAYICYSCCNRGGDIISFTEQRHNISFKEALVKLTKDWGLA